MYFDPATGAPSDTPPAWVAALPKMAAPPAGPTAPQAPNVPTGSGNPLAGLGVGGFGALSAVGRAGQGLATLVGAGGLAAGAKGWAEDMAQKASTYEQPGLENWSTPQSWLYQIAKSVPITGAAIAGAATGGDELAGVGAAAALAPSIFGENVAASEASNHGVLTPGGVLKAGALAVPETALNVIMPKGLARIAREGADGSIIHRALTGAGTAAAQQGIASGVSQGLGDEAYGPANMPFADRARNVVTAALQGGIMGGIFGGAFSAISPHLKSAPPAAISDGELVTMLDNQLSAVHEQTGVGNIDTPPPGPNGVPPDITQPTAGNQFRVTPTPEAEGEGGFNMNIPKFTQVGGEGEEPVVPPTPPLMLAPPTGPIGPPRPPIALGDEAGDLGGRITKNAQGQPEIKGLLPYVEPPAPQINIEAGSQPAGLLGRNQPDNMPPQRTPGPYETTDRGQLQQMIADTQARGVNATPGEAQQLGFMQDALKKSTTPGLKPGEGNQMPPAEVASREEASDAMRKEVTADVTPKVAAKDPLFNPWTPINNAEAVNAIDARLQDFDAQKKTATTPARKASKVPGWLSDLAGKYGLADANGKTKDAEGNFVTPESQIEPLMSERTQVQADLDRATAAQEAKNMAAKKTALDGIDDRLKTLQALDQNYKKAQGLKDRALGAPEEQQPIELGGPDAIRESGGEGVLPREATGIGETVGQGHPQGDDLTQEAAPRDERSPGEKFIADFPPIAQELGIVPTPDTPAKGMTVDDKAAVDPLMKQATMKDMAATEPAGSEKQQVAAAGAREPAYSDLLQRAHDMLVDDEEKNGRRTSTEDGRRSVPPTVVADDGNLSLRHEHSLTGDSVFSVNNGALDLHSAGDVRTNPPEWLSPQDHDRLSDLADQAEATDAAKEKAVPDGPWTGSEENVIGAPDVSPATTGLLKEWLSQIGAGAVRVFVHHGNLDGNMADLLHLHGSYGDALRPTGKDNGRTSATGPGAKAFQMFIRPGLSAAKTVQVMAHEVGHIIRLTAFRNAPPEVKAAITAAYNKWFAATKGMTMRQFVDSVRPSELGKHNYSDTAPSSRNTNYEYMSHFDEWFADNVSRWFSSEGRPLSATERFFAGVAQKMRQLLTAITGSKFAPDAAVKGFMDSMSDSSGDPGRWASELAGGGGEHIPDNTQYSSRDIAGSDDRAHAAIGALQHAWQMIARQGLVGALKTGLAKMEHMTMVGMDLTSLARFASRLLPSAMKHQELNTTRDAITNMKNKALDSALWTWNQTSEAGKKAISDYGIKAQQTGVDGSKKITFYNDQLKNPDTAAAKKLSADHRAASSAYEALDKAGLVPALNAVIQMGQAGAHMDRASSLWDAGNLIEAAHGVKLAGHGVSPDKIYQFMSTAHDSISDTKTWFEDAANAQRNGLEEYSAKLSVDAATAADPKWKVDDKRQSAEVKAILKKQELVQSVLDGDKELKYMADQGTYMPLSHGSGDFFVSAHMAKDENGLVKREASQGIQDLLEKNGFGEMGVFHDAENGTFMARVDSQAVQERLHSLLSASGHIEEGSLRQGMHEKPGTMIGVAPKALQPFLNAALAAIDRSGVDAATADKMKSDLTNQFIERLPMNSTFPNTVKRTFASGYDTDVGKAAYMAAGKRARNSTDTTMRPEIMRNFAQMRQEVETAQKSGGKDAVRASNYANEIMLREKQRAWRMPSTIFDSVQSAMHTLFIGANPAYVITALSQIPILGHGELAKVYGHGPAAVELGRAAPMVWKVLAAASQGDTKWNGGFREKFLRSDPSIPENVIRTVMDLENRGKLANNSYSYGQTDLAEGMDRSKTNARNMLNSMGLKAEMAARLNVALAADALYSKRGIDGISKGDYISKVVSNSQFNWGGSETSRLTGSAGPLGSFGRVAFAFTQFQTRMLTKLIYETNQTFGVGKSMAERKEAGTFLASHLVAVMAVSGTLGLPFAAFAAGALDKLRYHLLGEDQVDSVGLYRTWLAHTFGPEVADVVAKGLPRAVGLDFSKLGDANLLPGTGIMVDKRKFEDAQKDWYKSMAGAAPSEIGNFITGLRDMTNGDYMLGLTKLLPEGLKGLAEAGYINEHGYVDSRGFKYALQPNARDVLAAAMGIDPASLGQVNEAKRIEQGIKAQTQTTEQNISRHLQLTMNQGDMVGFGKWMNKAGDFQASHPNQEGSGPATDFENEYFGKAQEAAFANAMNMPTGVKPADFGIQRNLGFMIPQR